MKGSLYLGKISGIKLFIHWSFIILIGWIILSGVRAGNGANEILWTLAFILTIFLCITLHELGHALTAKRYNFKTKDIILLPIGGMARMEGLPEKPMQEFIVAIMGPMVNVVIATILFVYLKSTGRFPEEVSEFVISKETFLYQLYAVNLFLVLFNLIPAFPMDGGRIFRALLSAGFGRSKGTRIASYVGQFFAVLFVIAGFYLNPFLILIGVFVFFSAYAERASEETKTSLGNFKVADVIMNRFSVLHPTDQLARATSMLLDSQEHSFIVIENDVVLGTLSKNEIISGLMVHGKDIPVSQIMNKEVITVHPGDKIRDVIERLQNNVHRLVPVFDKERFIGVINLDNIIEFIELQKALQRV